MANSVRFHSESRLESGRHIVLVDDEPYVLQVHAEMVKVLGHSTTSFGCPLQAFEYLNDHPEDVDLLMTDYRMPGISGLELIAKLREAGIGLPSMILTGFPDEVDPDRAKACNARIIGKPISIHALSDLIQSMPLTKIAETDG